MAKRKTVKTVIGMLLILCSSLVGCIENATDSDGVKNQSPIVHISLNYPEKHIDNIPLTVEFTKNAHDEDGYIVNWTWDLGDGNTSFGANVVHTYYNPGFYHVKLTVEDNDGAQATGNETVVAVDPQAQQLNVEVVADKTIGWSPLIVNFSSVIEGDSQIVERLWDFDDYTTSTEAAPTHVFPAGLWNVSLAVKDKNGKVSYDSIHISVRAR